MSQERTIFMAEMGVVLRPDVLRTTLGSCVGVALIDEQTGAMGLAHVMLPRADEKNPSVEVPAKFANTAVPALLKAMGVSSADSARRLRAKIAGGANMFSKIVQAGGILQIGEQNIKAVREVLGGFRIPIVGENVGGVKGRLLVLDPTNKKIFVSCLGDKPVEF